MFGRASRRERTLILLALVIAVGVGYARLVYQPLAARLAEGRSAAAAARAELDRLRADAAALADLEAQVAALRAEFEKVQPVPGAVPVADLLALLARAERETGARVVSVVMGEPISSGGLWEHPLALEVTGGVAAQAGLLLRLEAAPFPLRVDTVAVEGTAGRYGVVLVTAGPSGGP